MFHAVNTNIDKFYKSYMRSEDSELIYEDPTYIGFNFIITFDDISSPLFYEGNNGSSAIKYLEAIGFPKKALMLQEMKKLLKDLIKNHPYYFQTLTGMKTLWQFNPAEPIRTRESELEFTTLETIDMKMTYIMNLYKHACYDIHYSSIRTLLPRNLRQFRMIIYLSEMRKFHTIDTNRSENKYHLKELKDLISMNAWDLMRCEFNFNDSMNYMEELTNNGMPEMASNSFKVKPGFIREQSTFKLFDSIIDSYNDNTIISNPKENFDTFEDILNPGNNNFDRFKDRETDLTNVFEGQTEQEDSNSLQSGNFADSPLGRRLANSVGGIEGLGNLALESARDIIQNNVLPL